MKKSKVQKGISVIKNPLKLLPRNAFLATYKSFDRPHYRLWQYNIVYDPTKVF